MVVITGWVGRGMPRRRTPARGEARLCRVSCANTKRFGTNSSCRNTHSVTSLHYADVWSMEQAVPRYHVWLTVTAAALTGSTYQTSDGASKRTQT